MKLGILYSGGKDSNLSLIRTVEAGHEPAVLLNISSRNPDSYMFHTPASGMVGVQSECLGIPLIKMETEGRKERELEDLEILIKRGIDEFGIQGVVTGAVKSIYQSSRIQRIGKRLGIWVFNPLWMGNEREIAEEALEKMEVVISGVAGYPLTEDYLGKRFSKEFILDMIEKGISPSGEGGEFETLILDSPLFKKRIVLEGYEKKWENWNGRIFNIKFSVSDKI